MKGWKDIKAVRFEFEFTSYHLLGRLMKLLNPTSPNMSSCPLSVAYDSVTDSERPDISGPIRSIKMYSCIQCAM